MSEVRAALVALRPELLRRARRLAGRGAEDLVQDATERALQFEETFTPGTNVRAWLHTILAATYATERRRMRCENAGLAALVRDPCEWPHLDQAPVMQASSPPVQAALAALPLPFRAVVVLVDVEEMPYADAAILLGVPRGTVMSRLYRGRDRLAELLGATT